MISRTQSEHLFAEALKYIPGGVNSPVRAFRAVGGQPFFVNRAAGCKLRDVDGNELIDYVLTWGPAILGHAHPKIIAAVKAAAEQGTSFGVPNPLEVTMAKLICELVPSVKKIRMTSSGTEACMSAVRVARGFTGKSKIIKFEGHYHGHADLFLKKAGSGVATLDIKQAGGVPAAVTDDTLVLPFNDPAALVQMVEQYKHELAAIIVEPVAGNMGCVLPQDGFLQLLRKLCSDNNIVLIFDEVMTGFRLSKGGAQEVYNVWADLVTFGKVIGGGLPVGAFGGRKDMMSCVAPLGNVYQAGTLSGNPLAMTAGLATLSELNNNTKIYTELAKKGEYLRDKMHEVFTRKGIAHTINQLGSMISVHFCENAVVDFQTASVGNNDTFKKFFHHLLDNGIYLPPSAFESWFLCIALSEADLQKTIAVCDSFVA